MCRHPNRESHFERSHAGKIDVELIWSRTVALRQRGGAAIAHLAGRGVIGCRNDSGNGIACGSCGGVARREFGQIYALEIKGVMF